MQTEMPANRRSSRGAKGVATTPAPGLLRILPRPRLIQRLDDGLSGAATVVCAPAGYGKTVLARQWADHLTRPVVWLSIGPRAEQVSVWVAQLRDALLGLSRSRADALTHLLAAGLPASPSAAGLAIVDALATDESPPVLVVDNQRRDADAYVDAFLRGLVLHAGPRQHMVFLLRNKRDLPLERLRANHALTELVCHDLEFTAEDVSTLVGATLGITLDTHEAAALIQTTAGWPALVQLAIHAASQTDNPRAVLGRFDAGHPHVAAYVTQEIIELLTDETQAFLRQTSILDLLNDPLCDAVTECSDGHAVLASLEQDCLVSAPQDSEGGWRRLHPVVGRVLRGQLSHDEERDLRLRAAHWLAAHDRLASAIEHWLAVDDMESAAQAVEAASAEALADGRFPDMYRWMDRLPDAVLRTRPALQVCACVLQYQKGAEANIPEEMQRAVLAYADAQSDSFWGCMATMMGAAHAFETWRLADAQSQAEELLERMGARHPLVRCHTLYLLAATLWARGDNNGALQRCRDAYDTGPAVTCRDFSIRACANLAYRLFLLGHCADAKAICSQMIETGLRYAGDGWSGKGLLAVPLGVGEYLAYNLEAATELLQEGCAASRRSGFMRDYYMGAYYLSRCLDAQGDSVRALDVIRDARSVAQAAGNMGVDANLSGLEEEICPGGAATAAWRRWLLARSDVGPFERSWRVWEALHRARLLRRDGRLDEALTYLSALEGIWRPHSVTLGLVHVNVHRALSLSALGLEQEAQSALTEAVRLAAPEGLASPFMEQRDLRFGHLVRGAKTASSEFVAGLLAMGAGLAAAGTAPASASGAGALLTAREQAVVERVASGRSNAEIADELGVTVGTVKKHLSNVFLKLNVASRTALIVRGRELGIIS